MCCCVSHEAPNEGYNQAVCANGGLLAVEIINIIFSIWNALVTATIAVILATYELALTTASNKEVFCGYYGNIGDKCDNFYDALKAASGATATLAIFNNVTYAFAITGVVLASLVCCNCKCCCSGPQQTNRAAGIFQVVASVIGLVTVIVQFIAAGSIGALANAYNEFCTAYYDSISSGGGGSVVVNECEIQTSAIQSVSTIVVVAGVWSAIVMGMRIFACVTLMQSSAVEYVESAEGGAQGAAGGNTTIVVNAQPAPAK
jgi:hypothetical protein